MEAILEFCGSVGGFLWGPWTFFVLMAAGILFTVWTRFSQFKALTHGVSVVRGKYDKPDDPGAINHFQALSAALSATVGLGNIGGVALAVAAGGPGAIFWMWIIGFLGMAIKTVEVSLSMLFRDTDDPDDPHGGAMWVIEKTLGRKGGVYKSLARIFGVTFCCTLLISTITGGNMFQAWNVADLSDKYFAIHPLVSGIALAGIVGLVIVGGIKRIGTVAGKLVPFMCVIYLLAAFAVLFANITDVPRMLGLIVTSAFSPQEATGAFLGGSLYWAFSVGLRRALFSNEAGQGSAPIAHSAAKTDEPVREGVVSGLEPFIDTICICTLTALVILSTNTWNRDPLVTFTTAPVISDVQAFADSTITIDDEIKNKAKVYMKVTPPAVAAGQPQSSNRLRGALTTNDDDARVIEWSTYTAGQAPTPDSLDVYMLDDDDKEKRIGAITAFPPASRAADDADTESTDDDRPLWGLLTAPEVVDIPADREYEWSNLDDTFIVVEADENEDTSFMLHQLDGTAVRIDGDSREQDGRVVTSATISAQWSTIASKTEPKLAEGTGMYRKFEGAALTAYAFDRQFPGLGKYLVTFAAWLFAISTMISWSYYGEQGVIYMVGRIGVLPYKLAFLGLAIVGAVFITDAKVMEPLMDLGTGAMLYANMPIVLMMGYIAVRELDKYFGKLKRGEFHPHDAPPIIDVVEGKDVEKD